MAQYTGVVRIKVNGELYETKPGATLDYGGPSRTEQMINGDVTGFSETPQPSVATFTIGHQNKTTVADVHAITEGILEFVTDVGVTFSMTQAFSATPPTLTGDGEGISCEFKGAGKPVELK